MSQLILLVLFLGVGAGMVLPDYIAEFLSEHSMTMLLILVFSVGIDLGMNKGVFADIKKMGFRILLVPASVILGTLLGGAIASVILQMPLKESLAIVSGLGWYSLSSVLMSEAGNPVGGTISFLSNVIREMFAFVCIPLIAKKINGYVAVGAAATASMDVLLGVISKNTDSKIALIGFVSGVVCSLSVPILVPLFV